MFILLRGVIINAFCAGISLFFGLPAKVANMIGFALSTEQSIGVSLIIGTLIAVVVSYFLQYGFNLPSFNYKYLNIYNAALRLRKEKLKQGNTMIEVIDEMDLFKDNSTSIQYYAEHALGDNVAWGRRKDSDIWEKLDDRKNLHKLRVTLDGKSLMRDDKVIYPEAKILKSDFKKYMNMVKKHD